MEPSGLIVFALALTVAAASPGPAITALVARVLVRGTAGAAAFMLGLSRGRCRLAHRDHPRPCLPRQDVRAGLPCPEICRRRLPGLSRVAVLVGAGGGTHGRGTEGGAPAQAVLRGALPDARQPENDGLLHCAAAQSDRPCGLSALGYAELVALTFVILICVDGSYVLLASRARRLFPEPRAMRWVNRGSGALLAGAAVAVASR